MYDRRHVSLRLYGNNMQPHLMYIMINLSYSPQYTEHANIFKYAYNYN